MKTIGLIGGMSYESTIYYYQTINQLINNQLGNYYSAKIILHSMEFNQIQELQKNSEWEILNGIMIEEAKLIQKSGAELLLICSNTMHKTADAIQEKINIPLLHIADATGKKIKNENMSKIGLLGTRYTMEEDFYKTRMEKKFDIQIVVPQKNQRKAVHDIIFNELVFGIISEPSRRKFINIIENLQKNDCEGIILGCTEIPLLVRSEDVNTTLFDTTFLHAKAAVDLALKK